MNVKQKRSERQIAGFLWLIHTYDLVQTKKSGDSWHWNEFQYGLRLFFQMIQTSQEYESLERALPMFDLDADGFISAFEISRVASQAGVPEHSIPTLIRSLRMGPAGWVL